MTPPGGSSPNSALFLTPEAPQPGTGGGGLRSASLLEYLRTKYDVTVASFTVPHHSKAFAARAWRNGIRLMRGVPPLIDRFSGFESQLHVSWKIFYRNPQTSSVFTHLWVHYLYKTRLRGQWTRCNPRHSCAVVLQTRNRPLHSPQQSRS